MLITRKGFFSTAEHYTSRFRAPQGTKFQGTRERVAINVINTAHLLLREGGRHGSPTMGTADRGVQGTAGWGPSVALCPFGSWDHLRAPSRGAVLSQGRPPPLPSGVTNRPPQPFQIEPFFF